MVEGSAARAAGTSGQAPRAAVLAGLALLALGACGDGPSAQAPGAAEGAASGAAVLVETDIEAPEVFQVTEEGLWDGRPSLGGVWVAHPDVADPERVLIRNEATGASIVGALFRRERDAPGPALQVSSDAAEALAMLAGAPEVLRVTALRREEAPPDALPDAPADAPPGLAEDEAFAVDAAVPPEAGDPAAADTGAALVEAPAPEPAPAPADADLRRPFVQLGIFSVEANAEATAGALTARGLSARVEGSTVQGQPSWRVLVGPALTVPERDALLARVRAEGFADAYAVSS